MEVVCPPKDCSGPDVFQSGGFGELRIGELGNQDEYVDIDDDDNDAGPQIESGMKNNAPVAGSLSTLSCARDSSCCREGKASVSYAFASVLISGVSWGATGVRTGAKSMAGSTLAPQEVAGVSSTSSHGRREQHTAGSQGSVGRSSRSVVVGGSLPQPTAGADGSPEDSYGSVPEVFKEETSKRSVPNELQTQMSIKSDGIRRQPSVGLSKSLSKSVDKDDEDGIRSRERDAQVCFVLNSETLCPCDSTFFYATLALRLMGTTSFSMHRRSSPKERRWTWSPQYQHLRSVPRCMVILITQVICLEKITGLRRLSLGIHL